MDIEDTLPGDLGRAVERLFEEFRNGLDHGHFEIYIKGEVGTKGRREITILSGRSHRFVISEADAKR